MMKTIIVLAIVLVFAQHATASVDEIDDTEYATASVDETEFTEGPVDREWYWKQHQRQTAKVDAENECPTKAQVLATPKANRWKAWDCPSCECGCKDYTM